jgi:S-formylglutathione hydrolase FrmB
MRTYVEAELPALIAKEFPMADLDRQGNTGHSMGGHGALMISLRNPGRFRSVSAFAHACERAGIPASIRMQEGYTTRTISFQVSSPNTLPGMASGLLASIPSHSCLWLRSLITKALEAKPAMVDLIAP